MKTNQSYLNYRDFQAVRFQPAEPQIQQPNPQPVVKRIWQAVLDFMTVETEPRIKELVTDSGKILWQIEDPLHHQSLEFDSEEQVVIWLEERHRQQYRRDSWNKNWGVDY
jgi:hypothetical protein